MLKRLFALLIFLTGACVLHAQNNPAAAEAAIVRFENARFTVLTDRLIRMEWSEDGIFEDNATLAIVNRNLPVPSFSKSEKNGVLIIKTESVVLEYRGGEFAPDNLSVSFKMNGRPVVWHPGDDASGNLRGTSRTLDGCMGFSKVSNSDNALEPGILSRDGWAVVDESQRHILVKDSSDWGEWVAVRPEGNRKDLYMFAYGHDYTGALSDYTKIAGKIPMPPKYTFGYWWSRYWIYTDEEIVEIASQMRSRGIPMDIFIIDMDWHLTWKDMDARLGHDEFGQRRGWTGYTWNRDLIPDPQGLLTTLHSMKYKTALNLHPASGIRPYEDCYKAFVKDYLSRTGDYDGPKDYAYPEGGYKFAGVEGAAGKAGYLAPVPFRLDQQEWADAYFNSVIHPLEEMGVDFWWLDWQQWRQSRYVTDLSNTFWCNYAFFNDKVRRSRSQGLDAPRPFIYHRWGGLGSHRYQIGFSGDTYDEWSVLEFLPYFTATASNVGYGYWGHDIGGHMQARDHKRPTEPEMYTRWLQYGVFTPIFKTHSTQNADLDRRIWSYPSHYQYMKEAIELRYALTPYIYDAARIAYDTGVSMTRPLYYVYPEEQKAYECNQEFFFGDNILATVLCQPADPVTGKTERKMWLPKGDWYDMAHHTTIKGGCEKMLYYAIDENPWFVKAGSIIPLAAEGIQNLQDPTDEWRILVVPGNGKSSYTHYEDDGLTQNYVKEYATTLIMKEASGSRVKLTVAPRKGFYKGASDSRKLSVLFEGLTKVPRSVTVNGKPVSAQIKGSAAVVDIPATPVSEAIVIEVMK
jgi:Alpha-glucosidases, family 31 of glycosyl hydrolases